MPESPPESFVSTRTTAQAEFRELRATIRERGSLRVLVFVLGLASWALVWAWLASSPFLPFISLVPLALLAGVFEAVNALHVGVERIGRYLEVFHEGMPAPALDDVSEGARWETTMTAFGRRFGGGSPDPLFSGVFATAVLLNVLPVAMLRPKTTEWVFFGLLHLAVLGRLVRSRRRAAEQRAADLDAFLALHGTSSSTSSTGSTARTGFGSTAGSSSDSASSSSSS